MNYGAILQDIERKEAAETSENDNVGGISSDIQYFGNVNDKEAAWLVRNGRKSYSGGELQPIMVNGKMVGGIHWALGGIDYLQLLPEYKGKRMLRKVVMSNMDKDSNVRFVTASPDLQQKLTTYGTVTTDEETDITTVYVWKM